MNLSSKPWNKEVSLEEIPSRISSMILWPEQKLLHWLTREYYNSVGLIAELGCFIGSSTLSLISGLEARSSDRALKPQALIHSYDLFLTPDDDYTLKRLPGHIKPGDSFREVYDANLGEKAKWVEVHAGDLRKDPWKNGPIEILFIDICKCWSTNQAVLEMFYPHLIPGKSIIVQQDFVRAWNPWIPVSMAYLSEYFEIIGEEESSRIYRLVKAIPEEILRKPMRQTLSLDEKVELMRKSIQMSPQGTAAVHEAGLAMLLFMEGDEQSAREQLEEAVRNYPEDANAQQIYVTVRKTMDAWKTGPAYEAEMENKF